MPRSRPRFLRIARYRVRRFLRKVDRETPEWARWLTPWGTSLALHALGLLLLAIVVSALGGEDGGREPARFGGQLVDDMTSSANSDHAGDPFTTLVADSPPSLSLDPQAEASEIRVADLNDSFRIGPTLNLSMPSPSGFVPPSARDALGGLAGVARGTGMGMLNANLPLSAPFAGRQADERARMVRSEGGTVESEKAVELGLEWIARHQRPDGSWALDTRSACKGEGCPDSPAMVSDTAATGLALLPLLGAGHTHTRPGRYQKTIERGLHWLMKVQQPSGELFTGGGQITVFYSHAIATMALCEAYGLTRDKRLRDHAQKAVFFINRNQNRADGGWRYQFGQAGDTSVFGWQMFALRSAHLGGLDMNKAVLRRAREFLDQAASDPRKSTYGYLVDSGASPTMTAEALVCRQLLGWPRDLPPLVAGTAKVAANLAESHQRNIYYWYYATQLLHNMRGKEWEQWNAQVRDGLIAMQTTGKGCDRGSWDPLQPEADVWGSKAGRLYTTSLSLLTLEVYYRYLPLYKDRGGDVKMGDEGIAAMPADEK